MKDKIGMDKWGRTAIEAGLPRRKRGPRGPAPKGCEACRHCIPDPHPGKKLLDGESGMVCAQLVPMLYAILSDEDLQGSGPINTTGGRFCKAFEPRN